jgi:hypothetical protein
MAQNHQSVSSISDIRSHLVNAIKNWTQQTNDLTWPEGDSSMAAMDVHIFTLRTVNAQLATIEGRPLEQHKSIIENFDEESIQDPGKFASFADSVGMLMAA